MIKQDSDNSYFQIVQRLGEPHFLSREGGNGEQRYRRHYSR
jgi:hypothetical protein